MPKITSNTLVKYGMPFIRKVLEQVEPYMSEMVITLSENSDDETESEVQGFAKKHNDKVFIYRENVKNASELTDERKKQLEHSTGDWILFLDDDDYWPKDQLELCLKELDLVPKILAYSVIPYQLIDYNYYDTSWERKSFSKFLRREGLHFSRPWPRDLPMDKDNEPLYWETHPQVKQLPYRFFHLSNLKDYSFRNQKGFEKYKEVIGQKEKLIEPFVL